MEKLNILIVTGNMSPMHDYRRVNSLLRQVLEATGRFRVYITEEAKGITAETLSNYSLVFINYDGAEKSIPIGGNGRPKFGSFSGESFGKTTTDAILTYVRNGGGAVMFHSLVGAMEGPAWDPELSVMMGGFYHDDGRFKRWRDLGYEVHTVPGDLVTEGVAANWKIADDDFLNMMVLEPGAKLLASIYDEANEREAPVMWKNEYGKGRVFSCALGHQEDTIRRLDFVRMLVRGCDWAACGRVEAPMPDRDSGSNWMKGWPWYYCDGCDRGL